MGTSLFCLSASHSALNSAYVVGGFSLYLSNMSWLNHTRWPTEARVICQTLPFQVMKRAMLSFGKFFIEGRSVMCTIAFLNASALVPEFHAMTLKATGAPPVAGAAAAGAVVAAAAAGAVVAAPAAGAVVAAAAGAVVAAAAGAVVAAAAAGAV